MGSREFVQGFCPAANKGKKKEQLTESCSFT
jgi:hypothetical protein